MPITTNQEIDTMRAHLQSAVNELMAVAECESYQEMRERMQDATAHTAQAARILNTIEERQGQ